MGKATKLEEDYIPDVIFLFFTGLASHLERYSAAKAGRKISAR